MRRLLPAIVVVLAGCPSAAPASIGANGPPTPASTASAAHSAVTTLPLVVVTNLVDQTHYTVALVGLAGRLVAQATAVPGDQDPVPFPGSAAEGCLSGMSEPSVHLVSYVPGLPNAGVCCDAFLPTFSMSNTRLYFPDGLTAVRFLGADGSTRVVTSLPNVAGRARAIFAVSPDDKRIAVSVFDWSTRPMTMLYVEDLAGGGHHVEIFSSTSLYEWPVGWHDGQLVLAGGPAFGGAANQYAASWYHLVDASTGNRIAVLAETNACPAIGPLSPAGTACVAAACHCIEAVDWLGARRQTYVYNDQSEFNWAALSPDGHAVILSEIYGTRMGAGIWRDGSLVFMTGYDKTVPRPQWLEDAHTVVSTCQTGGDQCIGIQDLASQAVVPVAVPGQLAGIPPGGL